MIKSVSKKRCQNVPKKVSQKSSGFSQFILDRREAAPDPDMGWGVVDRNMWLVSILGRKPGQQLCTLALAPSPQFSPQFSSQFPSQFALYSHMTHSLFFAPLAIV